MKPTGIADIIATTSKASCVIRALHRRRFVVCVALVVCVRLAVPSSMFAQDERHPQRGFNPGASYAISDIESISTTSGNLMLNIPLGSLPAGRAGSSGFTLGLTYNSKLYDTHVDSVPNDIGQDENRTHLNDSADGGWRYTLPSGYVMRPVSRLGEEPGPPCSPDTTPLEYQRNAYIWKMQVLFPDGSVHEFRPYGYTDQFGDGFFNISANGWLFQDSLVSGGDSASCTHNVTLATTAPMVYYSTDGSYTRLVVQHDSNPANHTGGGQWTLYFPDGRRVTNNPGEPQRTYDRNNNYVDCFYTTFNGHPAYKIIDQFGRSITVEMIRQYNPSTGLGFRQDYIYVKGAGGTEMVFGVHWKKIYVRKQYYAQVESGGRSRGNTYLTNWEGSPEVVDQISLPVQAGANLQYTFGYNAADYTGDNPDPSYGWGELNSVTLPSGAKASYEYVLDRVSAPSTNRLPQAKNVLNNKPKSKTLVYRQEYELTSAVSNTPCNPQAEQCASETWSYGSDTVKDTDTPYITEITGPDGGVTSEVFDASHPNDITYNHSAATIGPDGTKVERLWQQNRTSGMTGQIVNPFVKTELTSIKSAAGSYVKTAIKDYDYDKNGNITAVREYDWVIYGSVPRDAQGRPTGIPQGIAPKRITTNRYYNQTPDASDTTSNSPYAYYQAGAPQLLNAVRSSEVGDNSQTLARSEFYYDAPGTTGNLTELRSWDSTKEALTGQPTAESRLDTSNSVSVFNEYDPLTKNRTAVIDARGMRTSYIYGTISGPDGPVDGLYPTEIKVAEGTGVQRRSLQEYDFHTGLVTRTTDADNTVSTSTEYDVFGRPTLVKAAEGLPEEARTVTVYSDVQRRVIVRSDMNSVGDGKLVAIQHYDQLGRVRLSRKLEDSLTQSETDETAGIKVQTRYLYSGNNTYQLASNPYRAATSAAASSETTMGWSMTRADQSGRMVKMESFNGSALPAPFDTSNPNVSSSGAVTTAYDAETTTVTDQDGKKRKSVVDALGRLIQVYEAPGVADYNFLTSYSYDARGNLTQVTQGAQTRTFTYSSLSRLTSATNPEVCQQGLSQCVPMPVMYEYDANGNLKKKTDARGTQTDYSYDALNRVTARSYVGGTAATTPDVAYFYDSQTLPPGAPSFTRGLSAGRLVAVTYGGGALGSYTGGYDALGRAKHSRQVTDTGMAEGIKTYQMAYDYYLDGRLKTETYPSGKVVETQYDAAGRIAGVKNQGGSYYAGGDPGVANNPDVIKYTSHGATSTMKLGNGLWEHANYNSRLQPIQIGLGASSANSSVLQLDYSYGTTNNNGNVRSQTITLPGTSAMVQSYTYDELNRLKTAQEAGSQGWTQNYAYDRYGNRTLAAGTTSPAQLDATTNPAASALNNRLTSAGYVYDVAGNLLCDAAHQCANGGATSVASNLTINRAYFDYDAENRMVRAGSGGRGYGDGGSSYTYDGDGRRVRKATSGDEVTVFVYDAAGRAVAEYSNQVQNNGTGYLTQDHLGSVRAVTRQDQSVKARHDHLPFGEEVGASVGGRTATPGYDVSDNVRQRFASYERDNETGLDYAKARYYANVQGRFTSVDPLLASGRPDLPQSWNRYAYVLNNPLKLVDPTGTVDGEANKPRVVVVVFGGGAWFLPGQSGSSGSSSTSSWGRVNAGGDTKGIGESALDADSPHIAQQIKNDFPDADVIAAGPDAKGEVLKDLTTNKPDNIIIYGYSRGGVMAVELTNDLNKNGQTVDQLTTVDPVNKQWSDYKLNNTGMVNDAVNYYEYPYQNPVTGAKNVIIGPADRDPNKTPPTPVNHDNLDDIASPKVVGRIESKLKELQR